MEIQESGGVWEKMMEGFLWFEKNNLLVFFFFTGSADSEISEEQKKEKLSELRKKEQEIQDILAKKTKELKKICLREAVRNCSYTTSAVQHCCYILKVSTVC